MGKFVCMESCGVTEILDPIFLTRVVEEGKWSTTGSSRLTVAKISPKVKLKRGWVG
jgi:hypothetical protein